MNAPVRSTRPRRASVLVVLLALVLGSLGFAGTAYGAGVTAKQVKKIAAKVVKNQAPKLSVKHAETADSATTAGNATTAGTAGNATNLGGLPATTYLDRFAQSTSEANLAITGATTTQVLNAAVLTVPAGVGYVRVDASVTVVPTGNTGVAAWIQRDSTCVSSGDDYDNRSLGHSANQDTISINRIYSVTPGDHSFRMCVITGSDTQVDNRTLIAQTVGLAG